MEDEEIEQFESISEMEEDIYYFNEDQKNDNI
jgi:hypothetical protein